jgi:hypothetical protein
VFLSRKPIAHQSAKVAFIFNYQDLSHSDNYGSAVALKQIFKSKVK